MEENGGCRAIDGLRGMRGPKCPPLSFSRGKTGAFRGASPAMPPGGSSERRTAPGTIVKRNLGLDRYLMSAVELGTRHMADEWETTRGGSGRSREERWWCEEEAQKKNKATIFTHQNCPEAPIRARKALDLALNRTCHALSRSGKHHVL